MKRFAASLLLVAATFATAEQPPGEKVAATNPLHGDAQAIQQGATLFNAMNCDGCHGGGGFGFVGPSLIDGRWRFGGDEGEVFRSIRDGHAQGMPAYGTMLTDVTIWQLVSYLNAQPVSKDVPTMAWP